jgi:hypothetical protein
MTQPGPQMDQCYQHRHILDDKSVIGAATGERTLVMKASGRNISILHGELIGLIIALVLSKGKSTRKLQKILTDHLNSVRLIDDSQTDVSQTPRLRYMNGRSYYRWILTLMERHNIQIQYTPGHSTESTLEAKMNDEADYLASYSQNISKNLLMAPIPTFHMNRFTYFSSTDEWIESNISHYVDARLALQSAILHGVGNRLRMSTWAHDKQPPPDYPYTRAISAHSAAVQLYARSGQLATADTLRKRGKTDNDSCRLGCDAIETDRHLFVHCSQYKQWRIEAAKDIIAKTELKLETMKIEGIVRDNLLHAAKFLFMDEPSVWPLHHTMFYLGQIPDLDGLFASGHNIKDITLKRIKTHISSDWHTAAIRLAGRIFGDYQKRMAFHNGVAPRRTQDHILHSYISNRRR